MTNIYFNNVEDMGIADQPESIDENSLIADLMFFSQKMLEYRTIEVSGNEFFIEKDLDGSAFLYRKENFLNSYEYSWL